MPKIKFTATPKLPADYKHLGYKIGDEITAGQSWCDKWVNRGVAVHVPEDVAVAAESEVVVSATIDDDADVTSPGVAGTEGHEDPDGAHALPPEQPFRGRKPRK